MRLETRGFDKDETESHPPCNTNECAPSRQFDVAGAQAEDVSDEPSGSLHKRLTQDSLSDVLTVD